jgi:hypothetical protein
VQDIGLGKFAKIEGGLDQRGSNMSAIGSIATRAPTSTATGKRRGLLSRFVAALHYSRRLQAEREIERHRHLIEAARDYDARRLGAG